MTNRWAVAAALAVAAAPLRAEAAEPIRVTVVDARGDPVALADVAVVGQGAKAAALTGDDGTGVLALPEREGEPIRLEVSAPGKRTRTLTLDELASSGGRVVLDDDGAAAGADVVVQGRRISSAYTPQSIGKLEILTDPLARADALLAVANLPGSTNADSSADIQLRGSAAALSRAYFNDVPLYEVVRGSSVDRATRGFSVFNSSVIQEVEVYPTNPPLFLANSSGGAVRILPDDASSGSSTLYASLAGAGLTRSIPLGGDAVDQIQLYLSATELAPLLAVNPKLRDVTSSFRSVAMGASTKLHLGADTRVGILNVLDGERGRYPFSYFSARGVNASDRLRSYNVLTIERRLGETRLKVDASYTGSRGRQTIGSYRTSTRNAYVYLAADLAGSVARASAEYRVGIASEVLRLRSTGDVLPAGDRNGTGAFSGRTDRRSAAYTAAYGYISIRPGPGLTVAVATRQPFLDRPEQRGSYQATATVKSDDGRQRIILGLGRYSSIALPESLAVGRIEAATSDQLSFDYRLDLPKLRAALGVYSKHDRIGGVRTRVSGVDASLSADVGEALTVSGSFTSARPVVRSGGLRYRADNYLSYLVRLAVRAEVSRTTSVSAAFVGRNGTPYTDVVGRLDLVSENRAVPVFAAVPNQVDLRPYRTLDLNITNIMNWWPGRTKPIGFASVTNLLDRRNPSRVDFDLERLTRTESFYQRRALTVGLVFQL